MKRVISLFIILAISLSMLVSCSVVENITGIMGQDKTPGGSGGVQGKPSLDYKYVDFSDEEKSILIEHVGELIPFADCNKYYFEGIYNAEDFSDGVKYYTVGNTRADFENYVKLYSDYEFAGTYTDDFGDTWYTYQTNTVTVNISFYFYSGASYIDVLAYPRKDFDADGGNTNGGNTGGDVTDGNTESGYRVVDFTKAKHVKDVTDQGYYIDGCPTTGSPAVLVIPVEFSDVTAESKGYTTDALVDVWSGGADDTDYYSVHDYYYISSYGQLDLDVTVLDYWFKPQYDSSYYESATMDYYGDDVAIGDQMIMDEALAELSETMDLSEFDSDDNGIIDSVVLINTLDIGEDDFHWAYRYWNIYTDEDEYYYEYDGVSANDYLWASYQFIYESYDESGDVYYDESVRNTYTYIHEFGHVIGADDYYDTAGKNEPLGGCDIMDAMTGDHNAFTKFNYGWLTSSRLVTATASITMTLEDFSKNGDTIIIANNWDDSLGAYQEYYIVVYYTKSGLNAGEYGYFDRNGIIVYHVNAALVSETLDGETYYNVKNNNTDSSDEYGTEDNLIEFVTHQNGTYTYVVGDTLPTVKDDNGKQLGYTFTVDSLSSDRATITFTKR